MRHALVILAFKLCTRSGARFGGRRVIDRMQMRLLREVLTTMPAGSVVELPINSDLGPTVKLGKPHEEFN